MVAPRKKKYPKGKESHGGMKGIVPKSERDVTREVPRSEKRGEVQRLVALTKKKHPEGALNCAEEKEGPRGMAPLNQGTGGTAPKIRERRGEREGGGAEEQEGWCRAHTE